MSGSDWTLTPNLGLYMPVVDADLDMWGTHLNENAVILDTVVQSNTDALTGYLPLAGNATITGPVNTTAAFTAGGTTLTQPALLGAGNGGISYLGLGAIGQNIALAVSAGTPYFFQNGAALPALATQSYVQGGFLALNGGQMSGPFISWTGTGPTSPGVAIGDNSTGFWRSAPYLFLSVGGAIQQEWTGTQSQMSVPLLLAGDATAPLGAVTLQQMEAAAGGGGIPDAPSNSYTYGRYQGTWQPVLPLTGGDLTGQLSVLVSSGWNGLLLQYPPGAGAITQYANNGRLRWDEGTDGAFETGVNNAGSNYQIERYTDAGGFIDAPLKISRSSGIVDFAFTPTVLGVPIGGGSSVTVGDTPPASPSQGDLWFSSIDTQLYIRYTDPTSSQWVVTVNQSGFVTEAPNTGLLYARQNSQWADLSSVVNAATASQYNVGRNILTNGSFLIQQRGAGPFISGAGQYAFLERWYNQTNGTAGSITTNFVGITAAQRTAIGDENAIFAISNAVTGSATAGSTVWVAQDIEWLRRLSGKTITISFWAWAATGTPRVGVSWMQWFGSGGSPSAQVNGTGVSVTISTTPARYSVTFNVPSIAGKVFGTNGDDYFAVILFMSAAADQNAWSGSVGNQSGTFSFYGVQCEIGTVATPFDAGGTPEQILAECQRYYIGNMPFWFGAYTSGAGQNIGGTVLMPVTLRANPSVTFSNVTVSNTGQPATYLTQSVGMAIVASSTGTAYCSVQGSLSASADI